MEPGKVSRNNLVDIVRLVCAVNVIAAHAHPLEDINYFLGYTYRQTIPRFTVLYFFAIAGYFFLGKLMQGKRPLKTSLKKLFAIYAIWSVPYLALRWYDNGMPPIDAQFLLDRLRDFVFDGTWQQFWYFPSLFLSMILASLAWRLGKKKGLWIWFGATLALYLLGCAGCSYYHVANRVPALSRLIHWEHFATLRKDVLTGPAYFMMGLALRALEPRWSQKENKKRIGIVLAACLLYAAEYVFVSYFEIKANNYIMPSMYILLLAFIALLLQNPLPGRERLGRACLVIANFTYYAHELARVLLIHLFDGLGRTLTETPQFLLTTALMLLGGWAVYKANKPWLNRLVL